MLKKIKKILIRIVAVILVAYAPWLTGGIFGKLVIPKYSSLMAWKIAQPLIGLVILGVYCVHSSVHCCSYRQLEL